MKNKTCSVYFKTQFTNLYSLLHRHILHDERMNRLSDEILAILPPANNVLDIGCGDGKLVELCKQKTNNKTFFKGIEVANRTNNPAIDTYDGHLLPYADNSFDVSMICDVLHHLNTPSELLREAMRVSTEYIIIKDHLYDNRLDFAKLMLMDYIGNNVYDVKSIYNYMDVQKWLTLFKELDLSLICFKRNVSLYSYPISIFFPAKLHCLILVKINKGI